jgi:hypothetical protein
VSQHHAHGDKQRKKSNQHGQADRADARRREREAYYRSETLKKIAEFQGPGAIATLDFMREEDRLAARRRREGMKLGGLIMAAIGIGVMAFLAAAADKSDRGATFLGVIPLLIGLALLAYAYLLAPKEGSL